jgi:uncharacterized membrane protein
MGLPCPSVSVVASGILLFTRLLLQLLVKSPKTNETFANFYWLGFETTGLSPDQKRLA